jgi:hypothetical protein
VAWFGGCSGHRILFAALSNAACLKRHWIEAGATSHGVFAMGSHGHQGGVVSELLLANAPEISERLGLPDRREVTMTMREYEERFRSPPPSLHQTFVGIRGPNRSRRRSRYLWAVAGLVGGLIAGAVSDDFRLFR